MILVTGASGFIGSALLARIRSDGRHEVLAAARHVPRNSPPRQRWFQTGDLGGGCDWRPALSGVDTIIHAAAHVHVMRDSGGDPLTAFRRVNVSGTIDLARQAAAAGVSRFIFVSSVKVLGESTPPEQPFLADDVLAPQDPYAQSKAEAEQALRLLAERTSMQVVIIRPPLVYGPGVRAHFREMMLWIHRGVPMPLGAVDNRRSLVSTDNLVDLIATCIDHPGAGNATFLASDGEDLSTPELIRRVARALGRPSRLVNVPVRLLRAAGVIIGANAAIERLTSSLQVDTSKNSELLGWRPPCPSAISLERTAKDFLAHEART